jgi:hypothetical protein
MFSYETYKLLHLLGLFLVFLGFGGLLVGARDRNAPPKSALALHGIGLLIMLIAGFGVLASRSIEWPWPGWVFAKLGAWLLMGALPVLYKKGIVPATVVWLAAVAVGGAAAWLAIHQPF